MIFLFITKNYKETEMIESKRFVFIVVIMMGILLVVGNGLLPYDVRATAYGVYVLSASCRGATLLRA